MPKDPIDTSAIFPGPAQEWPIFHVLTRMLIQAFCPLFKSEILFGEVERLTKSVSLGNWIECSMEGELAGRMGVGCERGVLRALAGSLGLRNKGGAPDIERALQAVYVRLEQGLEQLCAEQDFECRIQMTSGAKQNYELIPEGQLALIFPLESRFGLFKVFFFFKPSAEQVLYEWGRLGRSEEPRKIRVYASQLESVFSTVKEMEALEKAWLEGPHIRAQLRARIKRLKRTVHHLKSESLETLFSPARKLTVEIAKQQGKQVQLVTQGTWLSLDKGLLNYLYEPTLHLIRNAVDHGIEEPSERERVGKPAQGHIRCRAAFSEKGLRLIVSDDGRGFDFPRIRSKAVAQGLITRDEAELMVSQDLCPLVFRSGFSTRDRADAISGRGLGLDIVKKGIEALGGSIRILSTSNHGTAFEILIPLSEEFTTPIDSLSPGGSEFSPREQEERVLLLDEMAGYFDRLFRSLSAFTDSKLISAAYEAYRLVHSIKGSAGFLGWGRVAAFCHYYEELLKLIAEEKTPVTDQMLALVLEVATKIKEFSSASRSSSPFPLLEVRRLEAKLMQAVWSASQSDDNAHFFFGKYHLNAVESLFSQRQVASTFRARPEGDFQKAMIQPYGALVQFNGDRRGYAGILMPEATFLQTVHPFVSGSSQNVPVKARIWTLGEFAGLMGTRISEIAQKAGINLQPSAPLTYYGWGEPLRILGNPTYCYACEIQGSPFFLAGDFRSPQDAMEYVDIPPDLPFQPSMIIEEARKQCEKHFGRWNLKVQFQEVSTQSDLIGFDGGVTVIISCVSPGAGHVQSILFMSYESTLANFVHRAFAGQDSPPDPDNFDLYDCLNETSNIMGGLLVAELERRKLPLKLSLPTVFVGKAYVANFNRLFVTNKWVGNTPHGKLELQVLVTNIPS